MRIVPAGLVSWYPFNGNANDSSGNGNNGTNNGATLTLDRFGNAGKAFSFDGISNNLNTNYAPPINDISISVWFTTKTQGPNYSLFSTSTISNNQYFAAYLNTSNQPEFAFSRLTANSMTGHIATAMSNSNWHHLVITRTNGSVNMYLDGVGQVIIYTQNVGSLVGSISTGVPLYCGANYAGGQLASFYQGALDDIRIYNRVLTQSEVTQLYQEGGWTGHTPPVAPQNLTVTAATVSHAQVEQEHRSRFFEIPNL